MMVLRSRIEKSVERVAHQLRRSHQTTIPAISSNSGRRRTANAKTIENGAVVSRNRDARIERGRIEIEFSSPVSQSALLTKKSRLKSVEAYWLLAKSVLPEKTIRAS